MPHKTRKEKIIADLRRKISSHGQHDNSAGVNSPTTEKASIKITVPQDSAFVFSRPSDEARNRSQSVSVSSSSLMLYDYRYITSDLRRTFLLTIFVLFLELMLYWALELGGINLLSNLIVNSYFI